MQYGKSMFEVRTIVDIDTRFAAEEGNIDSIHENEVTGAVALEEPGGKTLICHHRS